MASNREIASEAYDLLLQLVAKINEGNAQGIMIMFALEQGPDKTQQIKFFDAYEKMKLGN